LTISSLIELIASHEQENKLGITIVQKGEERLITYAQLFKRSQAILKDLQSRGLGPKDQLVLQLEDIEEFLYLFWASILGGIIPVPVAVGSNEQRNKLLKIWGILERPYLVTTHNEWDKMLDYHDNQLEEGKESTLFTDKDKALFSDDLLANGLDRTDYGKLYEAKPQDIAFIQFSSGSTGDPKGVVLTHENLLSNMYAIVTGALSSDKDVSLSWMPLTHDMGLIGFHLTPMLARVHQFLMLPALFVTKPMIWMEKVHEHRITITSSPNFGYYHFMRHFKPDKVAHWDLSSLRLIFNGAEPISYVICMDFLKMLESYGLKKETMFPVYGMAEASLAVTFPPVDTELQCVHLDRTKLMIGEQVAQVDEKGSESINLVDVGYPVNDCSIRIVDTKEKEVLEGYVGQIQIKGCNVTQGYYRRPNETASVLTLDGWLDTGDIGVIVNGRLFVIGRRKEIIFVNGQNIYPYDVERMAEQVDGIEIGKIAVCGMPDPHSQADEMYAFVQFRGSIDKFIPLWKAVGQQVLKQSGLELKRVLPIKNIPKTTSGKIQRFKLVEMLQQGEFDEVIEEIEEATRMWNTRDNELSQVLKVEPRNETEKKIWEIWCNVFETTNIGIDDHFLELGGNSLKAMMVVGQIEETFMLDFPVSKMFEGESIRSLAELVEEIGTTGQVETAIVQAITIAPREVYKASSAQKRLYVLQEMNPEHVTYNLPQAMLVEGRVDRENVQRVWDLLIQRHEALRTSFHMVDGQVFQKIHSHIHFDLSYSEEHLTDNEQKVEKIDNFIQPFDLEHGPLFRAELICIDEERHMFLFDMHHIISDGMSMGILIKEFIKLYEGESLAPLDLQYKEIAEWKRTMLEDGLFEHQFNYWKQTFASGVPTLELPSDTPRLVQQSFTGDRFEGMIDALLTSELKKLAKEQRSTLYSVLLSAYHILLSKYSGQNDIVVGTAVAGRRVRKSTGIIGLFVNTLPIYTRSNESQTYIHLLQEVKKEVYAVLQNQDIPLEDIIDHLKVRREFGRQPMFDTMFTLQNMEIPELKTKDLEFVPYSFPNHTAKFDLTWECYEVLEELKLSIEYTDDLFKRETVQRMFGHYVHILKQIVHQPYSSLAEFELVTESEMKQIDLISAAYSEYPKEVSLHRIFEKQVELTPEHVALVMGNQALTYKELNQKANQLARYILQKGGPSHSRIAIILDRSIEMIVSILAVLKTGGAYVPIDPQFPLERVQSLFDDASVEVVITESSFDSLSNQLQHRSTEGSLVRVVMEEATGELSAYPEGNLEYNTNHDETAYIMYTSGSTGKPKGILTTHYNVARVVKNTNYIDITDQDALLQLSNYAFDGSTFDIYGALLNGARLVLVDKETMLDMHQLSDLISNQHISIFFTTTALFNTLVDVNLDSLQAVQKILFGGERVSVSHVRRSLKVLGPNRLIHVYGPTESTVFATYYPINNLKDHQSTIPIGYPISNTQLYVYDRRMKLTPIGVPGELYIAGDGLANGYLNLPEMTNQHFVSHPTEQGKVIYKTGDLVKRLEGGSIEFIDRIDKQVKIRGYRIELGEIENRLMEFDEIQEAVVDVRRIGENQILVAYTVATQEFSTASLKVFLQETLPYYMIPSYFVSLDRLPLNKNGKIDKAALPDPEMGGSQGFVAPENETENRLAQIWQEVLQVERVGREDHFLEFGGHSLKASVLSARIHKHFQVKIPIKEIFQHATVREQAAWISQSVKTNYDPIEQVSEKSHYPLTSAQERMYVQEQFDGVGTAYNIPLLVKLQGEVDINKMKLVWQGLVQRHEPLRTSFAWKNGQILQQIHEEAILEVDEVYGNNNETEALFKSFIQPFDLARAPLCRAQVVHTERQESYLFVDLHHIIADGISMKVLLHDFMALYENKALPSVGVQYKDYATWYNKQLNTPWMADQIEYWKEQLAGPLPVLNMPSDFPRPQARSFTGEVISFTLPQDIVLKLEQIAQKEELTQHSLLFSVYTLLLQKYTGQEENMIGSLVAGRTHPDVQSMVGMFNNFLPIRTKIEAGMPFVDFTHLVQQTLHASFENQDVPYSELMKVLPTQTDLSRNLWFDTMLVVHNEFDEQASVKGQTLELIPQKVDLLTAKLDMKLDLYPSSGNVITAELEYNTSLFKRETMERFGRHFIHLIEQITENVYMACHEIELIEAEEKEMILQQFNHTNHIYPSALTLSEWFELQVLLTPDQMAAKFGNEQLSYNELNERANKLARVLREKGVGADKIVAVMVERSLDMIIAIMAINKAGGAYLPIDPHYPSERVLYMLEDSQALLTCTSKEWSEAHSLEERLQKEVILLELDSWCEEDSTNLLPVHSSRNLAYVIYTSGSTGRPKGVMIEHEAVINRIHWMQEMYPLGEQDVILQKTPYTFDVSVWEIFWWSTVGASVVFLEPGGEKEPQAIAKAVESHGVTTIHFVPSMLQVFLKYLEQEEKPLDLSSLSYVFTSGEALPVQQVQRFKELIPNDSGTQLINLYGPTEATVDVSYYECVDPTIDYIPIGKPIHNIRLYVVNDALQLQPIGVPGQLAISGIGLARGYLGNESLTAEKFVIDPFVPEGRMYLTGDLVQWATDGNIQYLGRIDHQVKIRGVRIECGEIEVALGQHAHIEEVLVTSITDHQGEQNLCAYYTGDSSVSTVTFREYLLGILPEYMVPSYFVWLDQFPLSANGKIDRKALPNPEIGLTNLEERIAPRNETESKLFKLWEDVLGFSEFGVKDNFFVIGGHSLKATQLAGRIYEQFHVQIPLKEIFRAATIEQMVIYISGVEKKDWIPIPVAVEQSNYPLSLAQNRLFILQQMDEEQTTYNLPLAMRISGKLDQTRMEEALNSLVQRHEPLRTSFTMMDGAPVQHIHKDLTLAIPNWEASPDQVEPLIEQFIQPFKLNQAPLIRAGIIRLSEEEYILLMDMHHIVSDGMSLVNLTKEFISLYQGHPVPPLQVQYKDIAVWQQKWLEEEEIKNQEKYWLDTLSGELPLLNMPLDFPRPIEQQYVGNKLTYQLSIELSRQIKKFTNDIDTTLYMTLLAAFKALLYRYTNQDDMIVGLPVSGRTHPEMVPLVGMFVNTLAFRSYPSGDKTFQAYLHEVKEIALEAYDHQNYPFEKLVGQLDIPRNLSRNPLFDVMFVLQNMGIPEVNLDNLQFSPYEVKHHVSKVDLTFEIVEHEDQLILNVEYRTKLFKPDTITRLVTHYMQLLEHAITHPETQLADLNMVELQEEQSIRDAFNHTAVEFPAHMTIDGYFEQQVKRSPGSVAVLYENQTLTYRQLHEKSNQLARVLRNYGVQSETLVAIMVDRSLEMMIGILAILKAGAAYVPISPSLPQERITYLLKDCGCKVLITQDSYKQVIEVDSVNAEELSVILLEERGYEKEDTADLCKEHHSKNRAYVIYTSGSTGQPKGVVIEHHSVINRINWMQNRYSLDQNDVILQKTPITFDVSVWELFWWSFSGAKVCMLSPEGEKDPHLIAQTIAKHRVTTMHFVPSMLNLFLENVQANQDNMDLSSLARVFTSGEALNASQVKRFHEYVGQPNETKLINLYGPTEATVDVSYYECSDAISDIVPIGKPIDNIQLYIVNEKNRIQPIGIAGELCIAGVGLAREYLHRPELTEEKFVSNPFQVGTKVYRTGDLARWLPDGNIEYLGRLDHQVKIRGYRIECGEIEHHLLAYPSVTKTIVLARTDENYESSLCAYIVSSEELTILDLKSFLAERLPEYMVPAHFVRLEELPLSANGKIDRKQLPDPDNSVKTGVEYVEASSDTEQKLVQIWGELLQRKEVGIHDNFFDLGGNSLLLIRAHQAVDEQYPNQLKVADLFSYPTIAKLADYMDSLVGGKVRQAVTMHPIQIDKGYFTGNADSSRTADASSYKFKLEQKLYEKLQEIALAEKIKVNDICYAAYTYLWSQVSQQSEMRLYSLWSDQLFQEMDINLSQIKRIEELFLLVNQINKREQASFKWKDVLHLKGNHQQDSVLLLYNSKYQSGSTVNREFLQLFDVVLTIEEQPSGIHALWEYNGKRMKKGNMKEMVQLYVKCIQLIVQQYIRLNNR
jgi:fengycin family lipopeptide synthetase D